MPDAQPTIIVLTAPSGSGKTTIARAVLREIPGVKFSVSATTRPPRKSEINGIHYHFVSEDKFRDYIANGDLIEYEEVYAGRFYGTLRSEVERVMEDRAAVLLDIDVQGALNVKQQYGDKVLALFIQPPSLEVLAERLRDRGTETEETLRIRLDRAREEIQYADRFDAIVINDTLPHAIEETLALVRSFLTK